jgi:hypothetical protein
MKAKRCCEQPHAYVDVRLLPPELCQEVVNDLPGTSRDELRALFDQLLYLPEIDVSLQVRLGILTPAMDRAISALQDDDGEEFDRVLGQVVPEVDSLERRVELAVALIRLRDEGRISKKLAAVGVFELDRPESTLLLCSVAESLGVLAGEQRTPAGLLVASR